MPQCCACDLSEELSFHDFKNHINSFHKNVCVFECYLCKKPFQSKKSFYKHVSKNSICAATVNSINMKLDRECPTALLNNILENEPDINHTPAIIPNNHVDMNINLENNSNGDFDSDLEHIILSVISELYGDYGLSRKDAEKIISKFTTALFVPVINTIQELVEPHLPKAPKNIEINNIIGPVIKDNRPSLDEI